VGGMRKKKKKKNPAVEIYGGAVFVYSCESPFYIRIIPIRYRNSVE